MERPQVYVTKLVLGDVGRRIVTAAFSFAVTGEVLGTRSNRSRCGEVVSLEPFDHGNGKMACQVRVLPEALCNPAPARIARDVNHRREGPVDA